MQEKYKDEFDFGKHQLVDAVSTHGGGENEERKEGEVVAAKPETKKYDKETDFFDGISNST